MKKTCSNCGTPMEVAGWERYPYFCEETQECANAARDAAREADEYAREAAEADGYERYR